jgi:pimeloyl-ACP methyl ester carboxylesterase
LVIAGRNDPIVPVANGQVLAEKLPHNRYVVLDAGHRAWEEAAAQYAQEVESWLGGAYRSVEKAQ